MSCASIDILNAVILPILISVVVGVPLALYTGIVSARLVTFAQAKTSAVASLIELPVVIYGATNLYAANHALLNMWVQPHAAMLMDGQKNAARELIVIRNEIQRYYMAKLKSSLTPSELKENAINRNNFEVTRWRKICDVAFADYGQVVGQLSDRVNKIKPDHRRAFGVGAVLDALDEAADAKGDRPAI